MTPCTGVLAAWATSIVMMCSNAQALLSRPRHDGPGVGPPRVESQRKVRKRAVSLLSLFLFQCNFHHLASISIISSPFTLHFNLFLNAHTGRRMASFSIPPSRRSCSPLVRIIQHGGTDPLTRRVRNLAQLDIQSSLRSTN